jgi:predicted TPR repeat methyltransferase
MALSENAVLHDAYAATYDADVQAYDCHIAEVLFGLCYDRITPGQRLLDAGTGSGLSAELFAWAGVEVFGMDFSPAMLEVCRVKGFARDLQLHDIVELPWPYPSCMFDHLICCGVLHFISGLEGIFGEARRVLLDGGVFAFTAKVPGGREDQLERYDRQNVGGFEIFSHAPAYVAEQLGGHGFVTRKTQRCFVGEDLFVVWVAQKQAGLGIADAA